MEPRLLFLDEPALGHTGVNYKELWDTLFSNFKVIPGVHTCGNMDWDETWCRDIYEIAKVIIGFIRNPLITEYNVTFYAVLVIRIIEGFNNIPFININMFKPMCYPNSYNGHIGRRYICATFSDYNFW